MSDENVRMAHRHGQAWRDLDGNPVEPLKPSEVWMFRGLIVSLVLMFVGLVLLFKGCAG